MRELVINRTYDCHTTEIQTIHGQLAEMISAKMEPAPDEWDRGFNVDFFIKVGPSYIGQEEASRFRIQKSLNRQGLRWQGCRRDDA